MAHRAYVSIAFVLLLALGAFAARDAIYRVAIRLFGPPRVAMVETYEPRPEGPIVDHTAWDRLVREHVSEGGWVDYAALALDTGPLDDYLDQLAAVEFDALGRDEKLALLINAYNAFTLRLILDHHDGGKLASIRDIPEEQRWDAVRWNLFGRTLSLNQLEHEQIRPRFQEPRIHFALVCAAYSCPPLRAEAYTGRRLEAQLDDQTRVTHRGDRWFRFDAAAGVAHRTELYDWYRGDFEQAAESLLDYMARYSPELREALDAGRKVREQKIDYLWTLNSTERRVESDDHFRDVGRGSP